MQPRCAERQAALCL